MELSSEFSSDFSSEFSSTFLLDFDSLLFPMLSLWSLLPLLWLSFGSTAFESLWLWIVLPDFGCEFLPHFPFSLPDSVPLLDSVCLSASLPDPLPNFIPDSLAEFTFFSSVSHDAAVLMLPFFCYVFKLVFLEIELVRILDRLSVNLGIC